MADINDNIIAFSGGGSLGVFGGLHFDLLQISAQGPMSVPYEFALRLIATVILALVGGVFGLLGKDIYVYKIKPKIKTFKNEKNILRY